MVKELRFADLANKSMIVSTMPSDLQIKRLGSWRYKRNDRLKIDSSFIITFYCIHVLPAVKQTP